MKKYVGLQAKKLYDDVTTSPQKLKGRRKSATADDYIDPELSKPCQEYN